MCPDYNSDIKNAIFCVKWKLKHIKGPFNKFYAYMYIKYKVAIHWVNATVQIEYFIFRTFFHIAPFTLHFLETLKLQQHLKMASSNCTCSTFKIATLPVVSGPVTWGILHLIRKGVAYILLNIFYSNLSYKIFQSYLKKITKSHITMYFLYVIYSYLKFAKQLHNFIDN